jgi:hypothetical protein
LKELPQLVDGINSGDPNRQFDCAQKFRRLLSIERQPPINQVIASGVVPRLVQFLDCDAQPTLQFESAWALTNIASGTTDNTKEVISHGAVQIFVRLLQSPHANVREQAVWALGNIAGDSYECRDLVIRLGAVGPLLHLCTPEAPIGLLRNAVWALSNFCRGKPQPDFNLVRPSLDTLARLIHSGDTEVLQDACWALSYLSDDSGAENLKISAVIRAQVPHKLIQLLLHPSTTVQIPALRTVGNIVTGDDTQTQIIINAGALPCLKVLLGSEIKGIKKESCWTISNITAGNRGQIQKVIDVGIVPELVNVLQTSEFDIQKEAAWALSNAATSGDDDQKRTMATEGVIQALCDMFNCDDAKIIQISLEGVENILKVGKADAEMKGLDENSYTDIVEECQGLDKLEALQHSDNLEIYKKAQEMIQEYFPPDTEVDVDNAPMVGGDQLLFGNFPSGAPSGGRYTFT